jgi:hypothetical protein
MLGWMWRGRGRAHRSTAVAMTGLDEIFHPGAARAREFVEIQHEMVVPLPGAGDQPWDDGTIVIDLPRRADG